MASVYSYLFLDLEINAWHAKGNNQYLTILQKPYRYMSNILDQGPRKMYHTVILGYRKNLYLNIIELPLQYFTIRLIVTNRTFQSNILLKSRLTLKFRSRLVCLILSNTIFR